MMPKQNMSCFLPSTDYWFRYTSGARYPIVPNLLFLEFYALFNVEKPKSAIFKS